jgi:hypothetical protein
MKTSITRRKKIAAHYINVDLDLKSTAPLSPLFEAWSGRVGRLQTPDKDGRKYWLRLSLYRGGADPAADILEFCRLVRRLRGAARTAWRKASSREFDIGIQAGLESRSAEWVLPPTVVEAMHDVGGHLRLTVYSPLQLMEEDSF